MDLAHRRIRSFNGAQKGELRIGSRERWRSAIGCGASTSPPARVRDGSFIELIDQKACVTAVPEIEVRDHRVQAIAEEIVARVVSAIDPEA